MKNEQDQKLSVGSKSPKETTDATSMIHKNIERVNARIAAACSTSNRSAGAVQLLAVSKTKPASMILAAIDSGHKHFGENYLQEALQKIEQVGNLCIWHFIGAIQSNKTRQIAEHFDWVHTVSNIKVARRLNEQRPENKPALKIFLQINVDSDPNKSGFDPSDLPEALHELTSFERLELQGLMTLPTQRKTISEQQRPFKQLRQLQQAHCPDQTELSMGMSQDLEAAILEGATWVRIGTDIFGARNTL
ncbi:MAG: pyridoxal phosphate enzyme (YggS family) [Candidatus Azotimanducaceae bacterium]